MRKTSWVLLFAMLFATAPNVVMGFSGSHLQLVTQICTSDGKLDVTIDLEGVTSDSKSIVSHSDHCAFCSVVASVYERSPDLSHVFTVFRKFQQFERQPSKGLIFLISNPNLAPPSIS